jgi:hypothetical protein
VSAVQRVGLEEDNPFTNAHIRKEVAAYGVTEYNKGTVQVEMGTPVGPIEDYLNRWFYVGDLEFPRFFIAGDLWMSLSRMEVQSQYIPITLARGDVALLGLGMGHACSRIMSKESVDKVLVFEREPCVIQFFKECFSTRPGYDKVEIIEGDARKNFRAYTVNFVYADVYLQLLEDSLKEDLPMFRKFNDIEYLHYWGMERVLREAQDIGDFESMPEPFEKFFKLWHNTPVDMGPVVNDRLAGVYPSGLPISSMVSQDGPSPEWVASLMELTEWPGLKWRPTF